MTKNTRCGTVAIIGEPNAGKSTIINRLVGGKVSIVSPKVQTTRFNIRGICARGDSQIILVDTPGIFEANKKFEKAMVSAAWSGIGDADCVLLMLDASKGLRGDSRNIITKLKENTQKPVFLALNKVDRLEKAKLFELAEECDKLGNFTKIFMVSALKGDGVEDIANHLAEILPASPWLYPAEQMSDISLRLLTAEITREKIFVKLNNELPYSIFVETENWEESKNLIKISQAILVQREGQKKIAIGDNGEMIKTIGIMARREIEKLLDKKVHLSLFVKVKENWKENQENYRMLGLEF